MPPLLLARAEVEGDRPALSTLAALSEDGRNPVSSMNIRPVAGNAVAVTSSPASGARRPLGLPISRIQCDFAGSRNFRLMDAFLNKGLAVWLHAPALHGPAS